MQGLQTRKMYHINDKPIDRDLYQGAADEYQRPITLLDYGTRRVLARLKPRFRTLDDIIRRNRAAGGKWFEPSNMRYFGARLQSRIYPAKDGRAYFVTSERDSAGRAWNGRRLYSVRVALPNGDIETAGEFGEHTTGRAAHAAARKLAGESMK